MSAIDTVSAESLQNYTRKFSDKIADRAFYQFESAEIANVIDDVKGEIVLTDIVISDLSKRANPNFRPLANRIKYRPRILKTVAVDVDLEIKPKVLANSYLEGLRKKGQNNTDIPAEGQVMGGLANKIMAEQELAFWQAEETLNPQPDDLLMSLFDGAIKTLKKIRTSGHVPVPVAGGAYTVASIGSNINEMYESLGAEATINGVEAYCSRKNLRLYINYMKSISNSEMPMVKRNAAGIIYGCELENGMGWLYTKQGFGLSNLIFMTQPANIVWGTDDKADAETFKFQGTIKSMQMTLAYRVGLQFFITDEDFLAINDLN
jgi:hypothetical protein